MLYKEGLFRFILMTFLCSATLTEVANSCEVAVSLNEGHSVPDEKFDDEILRKYYIFSSAADNAWKEQFTQMFTSIKLADGCSETLDSFEVVRWFDFSSVDIILTDSTTFTFK